jgi:hypothetical protein
MIWPGSAVTNVGDDDMGRRDISGDGRVITPDPSKWEKPHDYGDGRHAGDLEEDDDEHADDDD